MLALLIINELHEPVVGKTPQFSAFSMKIDGYRKINCIICLMWENQCSISHFDERESGSSQILCSFLTMRRWVGR